MELYEQWFSDDTFHPATYAAAVHSVALSFLTLAAFGAAKRHGFDTQYFHSAPKWALFLFGTGVYLVQAVYLFAGGRWKAWLTEFRSLSRSARIGVYTFDAVFFFGAVGWLLLEMFFLR